MIWVKFLISGYLIFKEYIKEKNPLYKWIPMFLSLGIPGSGQIAKGETKKGLVLLILTPLIWIVGLFVFYIPTIMWWIFAAYDARNKVKENF